MKRHTIFMTCFQSSGQLLHVHTFLIAQKFLEKKWRFFQYVKKENVTYFYNFEQHLPKSCYQFLHVDKVLLSENLH